MKLSENETNWHRQDIYYVFILCNNIDWCMNVWNWNRLLQNKKILFLMTTFSAWWKRVNTNLNKYISLKSKLIKHNSMHIEHFQLSRKSVKLIWISNRIERSLGYVQILSLCLLFITNVALTRSSNLYPFNSATILFALKGRS